MLNMELVITTCRTTQALLENPEGVYPVSDRRSVQWGEKYIRRWNNANDTNFSTDAIILYNVRNPNTAKSVTNMVNFYMDKIQDAGSLSRKRTSKRKKLSKRRNSSRKKLSRSKSIKRKSSRKNNYLEEEDKFKQ